MGTEHNQYQQNRGGYPKGSYASVVRTIQLELIFLQHVTKNMVEAFAGVENIIWGGGGGLPRLFFGKSKFLTSLVGTLSMMLVNKFVLGILNHVTSADEKCLS